MKNVAELLFIEYHQEMNRKNLFVAFIFKVLKNTVRD